MFNLASVGCLTLPLRRLSIAPHSQEGSVFREGKTYLGMPSSGRRRRRWRRRRIFNVQLGASPCPTDGSARVKCRGGVHSCMSCVVSRASPVHLCLLHVHDVSDHRTKCISHSCVHAVATSQRGDMDMMVQVVHINSKGWNDSYPMWTHKMERCTCRQEQNTMRAQQVGVVLVKWTVPLSP